MRKAVKEAELPFTGSLVCVRKSEYSRERTWYISTVNHVGVEKFEEVPEDVAKRLARWVAPQENIRHTHEWETDYIGREAEWFVDKTNTNLCVYDNYPQAAERLAYFLNCEADRHEREGKKKVADMRAKAAHSLEMALMKATKGI
jgi:hypothetical protein